MDETDPVDLPWISDDNDDLDAVLQTDADVDCPWCGETVSITLDPYGGSVQEYTEDCEVCCNPWRVIVRFDESGAADVTIDQAD